MMTDLFFLILASIVAYLVGAIPSGLLIARWFGGIDIREFGSGNIGFTNVLRACGPKVGIPVLISDVAKAALIIIFLHSVLQDRSFSDELIKVILGLAVMLGNLFNIFMGFKGGKGVASGLGVFLALAPVAVLTAFGLFLVVFAISRYVSLASVVTASSFPILVIYFQGPGIIMGLSCVISIFVVFKHRTNIQRLWMGTEHRFGSGENR